MGQDHSKRTCGGPNPLVMELRAEVARLEGVIEGGKETIAGLEKRIDGLGEDAKEAERKHAEELEEQRRTSEELREAAAAEFGRQLEERDAEIARLTELSAERLATMEERAARIEVLEAAEAELAALRPVHEELTEERDGLRRELEAMTAKRDQLRKELDQERAEHKELQDAVEEEAISKLQNDMARSQERQHTTAEHTQELQQLREAIRLQEQQAGLDQATVANLEFKISQMDAELFGLRSLVGEDAAQSIQQSAAKNMQFGDQAAGDAGLSPYLEKLHKESGAASSGAMGDENGDDGRPAPIEDPKALAAQIWGADHGDMPTPPAQPDSPMTPGSGAF